MTTPEANPYRELFERSADAILIIEGETFVDCNDATVRMLRYRDKAQLLETHPSELSPEKQPDGRDSREKASEYMAIAFERGSHRFEWMHRRADGEVFPVEVLLTAIQESERRVLHVVWRDIEERKRLEAELRQSQRIEAIGKLAGGVAHDFNNLLVIMVGNADLLKYTIGDEQPASEYLEAIHLAADKATGLVRQLLAFSRKQELVMGVIDINDLLRRIQGLLTRLIGEDVELKTALDSSSLRVWGDPGQIEQVLMNLASNARDSMPDGGELTIATRLVDEDHPIIGDHASPMLRPEVSISITDSGSGMSAETLEHAFDPYFTTKAEGKGTGLGLATARGIIEQAGGRISIQSAEGLGTCVTVYLPLSTEEVTKRTDVRVEDSLKGGGETLLVVEDNQSVADLMQKVLCSAGYTVICASNGREALELFESRPGEIDLIVTDVIMPEMGGVQLVSALRAAQHSPRVLFVSGYTSHELSRLDDIDGRVDLLRKPFHTRDLIRRVARALA